MRVHAVPKSISPEMNEIAQLKFELTYFNIAVQHVNYLATETHRKFFIA